MYICTYYRKCPKIEVEVIKYHKVNSLLASPRITMISEFPRF